MKNNNMASVRRQAVDAAGKTFAYLLMSLARQATCNTLLTSQNATDVPDC